VPRYLLKCRNCGRRVEKDFSVAADKRETALMANRQYECECGARDWEKLPTSPAGFKGLPTERFYNRG